MWKKTFHVCDNKHPCHVSWDWSSSSNSLASLNHASPNWKCVQELLPRPLLHLLAKLLPLPSSPLRTARLTPRPRSLSASVDPRQRRAIRSFSRQYDGGVCSVCLHLPARCRSGFSAAGGGGRGGSPRLFPTVPQCRQHTVAHTRRETSSRKWRCCRSNVESSLRKATAEWGLLPMSSEQLGEEDHLWSAPSQVTQISSWAAWSTVSRLQETFSKGNILWESLAIKWFASPSH